MYLRNMKLRSIALAKPIRETWGGLIYVYHAQIHAGNSETPVVRNDGPISDGTYSTHTINNRMQYALRRARPVGIATSYGLDGWGSVPGRSNKFSLLHSVQNGFGGLFSLI
jgi:hypothetical protein